MPEINSKRIQNKERQKKMKKERMKEAKKTSERKPSHANITWEGESKPEVKEEESSSTSLYLILGGLFLLFLFVLWAFVEDTPALLAKEKARERAQARRNATRGEEVAQKNFAYEHSVVFNSSQLTHILRQLSDPQEDFERIVMVTFDDSTRDEAQGDIYKVKLFRKMEAIAKALPRKKLFQRYEEDELPMIALFDCGNTNDEHAEQVCKQLLQSEVPNILIYRRMSKPRLLPKEYRSDNQIVNYLHGLMQPPVTFLEERSECEDFVTNDRYLNVLFFGTDDTSVFESVADGLRDFARFARTKNPSNAEAFFASVPSILAWRTFGENPIAFGGNLSDARAIHTFVLNQYLPVLGEFNEHTQQQYMKRGLPIVWIAVDSNDDSTSQLLAATEKVASQYLGALSFVKLDVFEQPKLAENFELIPKKDDKAESEDDSSAEDNAHKLPQVLIMNQLAQIKQPINLDDIEGSINNVANQYFQTLRASRGDVQSELEGIEDDTDEDDTDEDEIDDPSQTAVEDNEDVNLDAQTTKEDL